MSAEKICRPRPADVLYGNGMSLDRRASIYVVMRFVCTDLWAYAITPLPPPPITPTTICNFSHSTKGSVYGASMRRLGPPGRSGQRRAQTEPRTTVDEFKMITDAVAVIY